MHCAGTPGLAGPHRIDLGRAQLQTVMRRLDSLEARLGRPHTPGPAAGSPDHAGYGGGAAVAVATEKEYPNNGTDGGGGGGESDRMKRRLLKQVLCA